ncbi:glycosyltransferase family 2 protein [Candidatus Daviesbacteria bacterium]|nr:glycosyltransferase family 2 protein [Candidatus Daviesbacteria bacterium]
MLVQNLSVFFPAFNEAENIAQTTEKAIKVLKNLRLKKWEILIIDDGSKDSTGKIADELAKKYPQIRVIHQPNGGYGAALRTGFYQSKYDWIVYTDSDGQFDFSEVNKFIDKTSEADLILGYRIKRNDPRIRLLLAKGWKFLIFLFFATWFQDVDCGFKMVSKKVLSTIPRLESSRGAMINPELALNAQKMGFKIVQVGVHHYPRLYGTPTGSSLKVIINSFLDLFKLWLKLT